MDCYYCKAKGHCGSFVQPGSIICLSNQLHYGGTHADDPTPDIEKPRFCSACGHPLVIRERYRYCNNTQCYKRFKDV